MGKTHLASALGLEAARYLFSTYCVNCHQLIEQMKKTRFENKLPEELKSLSKYKLLVIDEIGYLPIPALCGAALKLYLNQELCSNSPWDLAIPGAVGLFQMEFVAESADAAQSGAGHQGQDA